MDCIDRNSEISGYTVRNGPVDGTAVNVSVSGTNYTAVGLTPSTNYSFEVAAVNSDGGVGPFSFPIFARTLDLESEYLVPGAIPTTWLMFTVYMNVYHAARKVMIIFSLFCRYTGSQWYSHSKPWSCSSGGHWRI